MALVEGHGSGSGCGLLEVRIVVRNSLLVMLKDDGHWWLELP